MCETCRARAAQWANLQSKWIPTGAAELEEWLNDEDRVLRFDGHACSREIERALTDRLVTLAIMNGEVIERTLEGFLAGLLIFAYVPVGDRVWRPLHVKVLFLEGSNHWIVKTVYDPRSKPWKWSSNFTARICWCDREEA